MLENDKDREKNASKKPGAQINLLLWLLFSLIRSRSRPRPTLSRLWINVSFCSIVLRRPPVVETDAVREYMEIWYTILRRKRYAHEHTHSVKDDGILTTRSNASIRTKNGIIHSRKKNNRMSFIRHDFTSAFVSTAAFGYHLTIRFECDTPHLLDAIYTRGPDSPR